MSGNKSFTIFGDTVEIIADGNMTGGLVTVVTSVSPPGGGPLPHVHARLRIMCMASTPLSLAYAVFADLKPSMDRMRRLITPLIGFQLIEILHSTMSDRVVENLRCFQTADGFTIGGIAIGVDHCWSPIPTEADRLREAKEQ